MLSLFRSAKGPSVYLRTGLFSSSRAALARPFSTSTSPDSDEGAISKMSEKVSKEFSKDLSSSLTPAEITAQLDRYIIGQDDAKKAVAVAVRNRWRRMQLGSPLKEEVVPKNMLMIGPTGCGKTEIARRMAVLAQAPFVKVEATKFTEVGFHGRDVDMIITDLVNNAITTTKKQMREALQEELDVKVEDKILELLTGEAARSGTKESFRQLLRDGKLEDKEITIELPNARGGGMGEFFGSGGGVGVLNMSEIMSGVEKLTAGAGKTTQRRMNIAEARPLVEDSIAEKLLTREVIQRRAIESVEQNGIVFLDEVDKICSKSKHGPDASDEGVQRDLLPLIEGTVVHTKYGNISTEHILFIASGAFHSAKPSDLLAELQGRLPIRVELKALTKEDLVRILSEKEFNLIKQHVALMGTENVELEFTDDAIDTIASISAEVNEQVENIGARRLHTVIERIVEDYSFRAIEYSGQKIVIDAAYARDRVSDMLLKTDLSRFIL